MEPSTTIGPVVVLGQHLNVFGPSSGPEYTVCPCVCVSGLLGLASAAFGQSASTISLRVISFCI